MTEQQLHLPHKFKFRPFGQSGEQIYDDDGLSLFVSAGLVVWKEEEGCWNEGCWNLGLLSLEP